MLFNIIIIIIIIIIVSKVNLTSEVNSTTAIYLYMYIFYDRSFGLAALVLTYIINVQTYSRLIGVQKSN